MIEADVAVIGAGAAGLFAALAASGALREDGSFEIPETSPRVVLLDSRDPPGRKILISGGGRCNVTNAMVTADDYDSDAPKIVRSVLREFSVKASRTLFESLGITLEQEPMGKLFPTTNRARDVLNALLEALDRARVTKEFGTPVERIAPAADGSGWLIDERVRAQRVIIATGGKSVPTTGSRGFGYEVAEAAGHEIAATVPALAPLLADVPESRAGTTLPAILTVAETDGRVIQRSAGSLLFTHRGVSGPVALDVSGAVERMLAEGRTPVVTADFWTPNAPFSTLWKKQQEGKPPGACLRNCPKPGGAQAVGEALDRMRERRPDKAIGTILTERVPRRLVRDLVPCASTLLGQMTREHRRTASLAIGAFDLKVTGTEGYAKAEVTAGGVRMRELKRQTFESRLAPGLYFCGEVIDVTGRLGGFNFQWAWSSGYLAGRGALTAIEAEGASE